MLNSVLHQNGLPGFAICFSHLRWDFVFQRPQHLMQRLARETEVLFWEEPIAAPGQELRLDVLERGPNLTVARLLVPDSMAPAAVEIAQRRHLDAYLRARNIRRPLLWYYTPMMLPFSAHIPAALTVYDCMDELSAFRGAPAGLKAQEMKLLARADLVFTGGHSLYEARRHLHPNIHPFPSSVDVAHFAQARARPAEPDDQGGIGFPRLGYYGVIDERLDLGLLAEAAEARPDWQFVMIGPVAKIAPEDLPRRPNIHWLGAKPYAELPAYVAGWGVALAPFALNESTRFISPTKLPEYLAAGRAVVATRVPDILRHYGGLEAVRIAGDAGDFVLQADAALALQGDWLGPVDALLRTMSWDRSWAEMRRLMLRSLTAATPVAAPHIGRRAAYDYLIVGAGFAGAVLAERLARADGARVLLVDRRPHVAGNAYDHHDDAGILVHRYGPHIFHTNAPKVVQYLSRYTEWRPYEHRVLARVGGQLLPVPINRTTVNRFFGLDLSEAEVEAFLAARAVAANPIRTSEDIVLSRVGPELYEAMFRGYTTKQWGVGPAMLDKSVAGRIPVRSNDDDRYFADSFQRMPRHGYTRLFENMLDHPNITLMLGCNDRDIRDEVEWRHMIFTGPIDEYFDHQLGELPYRSLRFRHETLPMEEFQPVGVVNYPDPALPYTRITEYKHLTGQRHRHTSISYEYPAAEGDPYYPVPNPANAALFARYQALADAEPNVTFVGRLATYRYYNMDQVVAQALATHERLRARHAQPARPGAVIALPDTA